MSAGASFWSTQGSEELPEFMNGPVRNALGIIPPEVIWYDGKLSELLSIESLASLYLLQT